MFMPRDRELPAVRRKREKEELMATATQLLQLIEEHLAQAHPAHHHARRKADGSVSVTVVREFVHTDTNNNVDNKGKEKMKDSGETAFRSTDSNPRWWKDGHVPSSSAKRAAECHVREMVECVEQLNLLWERVVVFGGKEEIQETLLALPLIETLLRLLKRHPLSAALYARSAELLTPLVTENMDAKIRVERAKGVRVFGMAYQQFGPWAPNPPNTAPASLASAGVDPQTILADGVARPVAAVSTGERADQSGGAAAGLKATLEEVENKCAADLREVRLMLEKHAAFEAIRNFFFSLTKSISTRAAQYPEEERYLQRLKLKVHRVIYRPQLVEHRLMFMNRHILGYSQLWGGLKAEYDRMRKEFSYLHFVSLPTGHVDPAEALQLPAASQPAVDVVEDLLPSSPATTELEKKNRLNEHKTRELVRAEIREQKLEQVLCHVQLMEVKIDKLPLDVDKDGFPIRDRNPFVVIQQWRWKDAPRRDQPALWKSTIVRDSLSPSWDLRTLGNKESGQVATPRQRTVHKVRRALSGFIYSRNPLAMAICRFQLWRKRRRALKSKRKAEAFRTGRAVGVAADDHALSNASRHKKKRRRHRPQHDLQAEGGGAQVESADAHHHPNPKHLRRRFQHYVKEHHKKHAEEPRDAAVTAVVREMHNRFRARFFPPLKIAVFDWVSADHQEFMGRVEIDPAAVYLLEREVAEGRKRAKARARVSRVGRPAPTTTAPSASAGPRPRVAGDDREEGREKVSLSNRGRPGSFVREMIDADMESDEEEERSEEEEEEAENHLEKAHEENDDKAKENQERRIPGGDDHMVGNGEVYDDEEDEKVEKRSRRTKEEENEVDEEEKAMKEDEAHKLNEIERMQERNNLRREAELMERPETEAVDKNAVRDPDREAVLRERQRLDAECQRREQKEAGRRERERRKKVEQERRRLEQERKREEHYRKKREEEAKKRARKMSKDSSGVAAGHLAEERGRKVEEEDDEEGITVVLPLYAGEEERNTPGLERHHAGLSGLISITLSVTPPHWSANCPTTASSRPLPSSP